MNAQSPTGNPESARQILTVSQLNRTVAGLLERSIPLVWVSGEISNLTRAASGHWYFALKDDSASVRAVMFRGRNQLVGFVPREGDQVEARGQAGLYEARGEFQLNIETLRRAGAGELMRRFLELKARLEAEGLFARDRKRPLPSCARRIGVVSSLQAAALRDVLTTLRRRAPHVPVIVYPASVQGAGAPAELRAALAQAQARAECDVVLLVRGGGSIEDLWAFNDEALVRAIAQCSLPVVTGVGHETDFTLADFAADERAATPTAAAVLAAPDRGEWLARLSRLQDGLQTRMARGLAACEQRLDLSLRLLKPPSLAWARRDAALRGVADRLSAQMQRRLETGEARLDAIAGRLRGRLPAPELVMARERVASRSRALAIGLRARLERDEARLQRLASGLELVSPHAVLERGYAIVTGPAGTILRDAQGLAPGDPVRVQLARGGFDARVGGLRDGQGPRV